MKRFSAILFAVVLLIAVVGCSGNTRFSSAVDEDEFYDSLTYEKILEDESSVIDSETVYFPDGTKNVAAWHIEKTDDGYDAILEYADGSAFYFIGETSFLKTNGLLHRALNFGWPYEDYLEMFLDSGFYAPNGNYTLRRDRTQGGTAVTATFTAGDDAELYPEWNLSEDTLMRFVYEFDGKDRLVAFTQYAEDTVISTRTFTYGKSIDFPAEITDSLGAKMHKVTLVMPNEEYDISEIFDVPDNMRIYCSTGYTIFTDMELTDYFDINTPITDSTELYVTYE